MNQETAAVITILVLIILAVINHIAFSIWFNKKLQQCTSEHRSHAVYTMTYEVNQFNWFKFIGWTPEELDHFWTTGNRG